MRRNKTNLILIIALASWMVSALAQDDAPAFPPPRVEVARAELRELAPLFDVSGTVISLNDSRIAAEVEGVLTWLANVGDRVGAGDVIARIEPRLMDVAVARAQAAVARLRADLEYREQQLRRHEELAGSRHASEHLVDEARAQRDQALHQLADARAQLDRAEGDLERTEIRAPFAGHVVRRLASAGEYVAAGDDVLRLVDTQRLEISLPAPLELAPFIQPGLNVEVRSGETTRRHPVRALVPVGDTASRMVEIRLTVDPGDWLVGTPVQVRLPRATPRTLVAVPRDALVERDGRAFLFRLNDDGVAEQIEAEVAATVGLWVGVASGIEHGDRVVIRGAERLGPGQLVDVIP